MSLGFIYILSIKETGLVKIGQSEEPTARINSICTTGALTAAAQWISIPHANYQENERLLHKRFSGSLRSGREWFAASFEGVVAATHELSFERSKTPPTTLDSVAFGDLQIEPIHYADDVWLTAEQIGLALEYSDPRDSILKIYERNREELDSYSCTVKLTVQGQGRNIRIFNEEGSMLITMFSYQPKAIAFRTWAVKVLKAYRHGKLSLLDPRVVSTQIELMKYRDNLAEKLQRISNKEGAAWQAIYDSFEIVSKQLGIPVLPRGQFGFRIEQKTDNELAWRRTGKTRQKILAALRAGKNRPGDIAAYIGASGNNVRKTLERMVKDGQVIRKERFRYALVPEYDG